MAFAPQLARLLGADYSVVAKSGEGVVHNWGAPWPDRGLHTEERYRWTLYGAHKTPGNTIWQSEKLPAAVSPRAGLWIEETCERAQREGIPAHYIALNEDGPLLAPGDFVGDGTHPTKSGSARLARYLAPRLAPFLPHH